MRTTAITLLLAALSLAAAAPDRASGQGRGHVHKERKARIERDHHGRREQGRARYREFLPDHRTTVVRWYREGSNLPPGLAKRDSLPPGLMKQLRRNGHLPPGLERQMVAFPPTLVELLPPVIPGCERAFLGNVAVIWSPRTRVVFDFFAID
ncbi:MAG: hypothetical protein ACM3ZB_02755 [bacterium]|jgi:hypothetical protein